MQLTMTRSQFVQLCKMEIDGVKLVNPDVLAKAEIRDRAGDYTDSQGNKVIRTTIILPTYEKTVPATEYLKNISGKVTEKPAETSATPAETPAVAPAPAQA